MKETDENIINQEALDQWAKDVIEWATKELEEGRVQSVADRLEDTILAIIVSVRPKYRERMGKLIKVILNTISWSDKIMNGPYENSQEYYDQLAYECNRIKDQLLMMPPEAADQWVEEVLKWFTEIVKQIQEEMNTTTNKIAMIKKMKK